MCVVFISGHIMTLRKLTGGKRMCNFFLAGCSGCQGLILLTPPPRHVGTVGSPFRRWHQDTGSILQEESLALPGKQRM